MATHSLKNVQLPLTGMLNSFSNDSPKAKLIKLVKALCLNKFIQQLVLVLQFDSPSTDKECCSDDIFLQANMEVTSPWFPRQKPNRIFFHWLLDFCTK